LTGERREEGHKTLINLGGAVRTMKGGSRYSRTLTGGTGRALQKIMIDNMVTSGRKGRYPRLFHGKEGFGRKGGDSEWKDVELLRIFVGLSF